VWRDLVDADAVETAYRASKAGGGLILACPAVLYEMLRLQNVGLMKKLVRTLCRSCWVRMMPEAYEESMELLGEFRRLRPQWVATPPALDDFIALHEDWSSDRGVWWRARRDPVEAAAILREVEGGRLTIARDRAVRAREAWAGKTPFERMDLDTWTSMFKNNPPGWDGEPVETWRAETLQHYSAAFVDASRGDGSAEYEWLSALVDVKAVRREYASFVRLILYETSASYLRRNWLRWAVGTLQMTRKTGPGTPVDNQISSYLVDADDLVTGDAAFVSIIERVRGFAPVRVARAARVRAETLVPIVTRLLSDDRG
jgi:hypothetical protein